MDAGLNLYTLHKLIGTEEGLVEVTLRLKEMGYSYLQFSGAPFSGEMIARVSERTDIPFVLTHVPYDRIVGDTDRLMEEHALFGCKRIGLGWIPPETVADECECKTKIDELNRAAERMEKAGFTLFYHNHHMEFMRYSGESVFDYMIKNAPSLHFTLDTYWAQYGGVDVIELIRRLKGRIECVHLKDYAITYDREKKECKPVFAPVGYGNMDFARIVSEAKKSGAEYFFVEQDNACLLPDTWGEVKKSIDYIKEKL